MSKMRMAGEVVASAKWVGASGGPISLTSVTSSLLPISCLVSVSFPSFFLPCEQERHLSDIYHVNDTCGMHICSQRKVCWRLWGIYQQYICQVTIVASQLPSPSSSLPSFSPPCRDGIGTVISLVYAIHLACCEPLRKHAATARFAKRRSKLT